MLRGPDPSAPAAAPETARPDRAHGGSRAAVSLREVTKEFAARGRPPTLALDRVSLEIAPGEFVAIVGPSGCGKTTLLRVVAGLTPCSSGTVLVDGRPVRAPRRDVSIMFQSPTLLPWRKVMQNCLLPLEVGGRVGADDRARAGELLERAGLGSFAGSYPHELSGGMKQRVALCRALVSSPSVLLLDEPFGALDAMTREQMNLDLHRLWAASGITTILITHSIAEAVFLAQRVGVMSPRPGRILELFDVPLPEKREVGTLDDPGFASACGHVRSYFAGAAGG